MSELKPCKCRVCRVEPISHLSLTTLFFWECPSCHARGSGHPEERMATKYWNSLNDGTPDLLRCARIGLEMAMNAIWRQSSAKDIDRIRAISDSDIMKEISRE